MARPLQARRDEARHGTDDHGPDALIALDAPYAAPSGARAIFRG